MLTSGLVVARGNWAHVIEELQVTSAIIINLFERPDPSVATDLRNGVGGERFDFVPVPSNDFARGVHHRNEHVVRPSSGRTSGNRLRHLDEEKQAPGYDLQRHYSHSMTMQLSSHAALAHKIVAIPGNSVMKLFRTCVVSRRTYGRFVFRNGTVRDTIGCSDDQSSGRAIGG